MKSERSEKNDKAAGSDQSRDSRGQSIIRIPTFVEKHGNKLLWAVIVVSAIVLIFNWRQRSNREAFGRASDALADARMSIEELSRTVGVPLPPVQLAELRSKFIGEARDSLETVNGETEDRRLVAEAQVARGDLNWQIANLPPLPGSATNPALRQGTDDPAKALEISENAYKRVLEDFPDQKMPTIAAHFGLAAIAQNRADWNEAHKHYQNLITDASTPKSFQTQAKMLDSLLDKLEKPIYLAKPASMPSATQAIGPTTELAPPMLSGLKNATSAPASQPAH